MEQSRLTGDALDAVYTQRSPEPKGWIFQRQLRHRRLHLQEGSKLLVHGRVFRAGRQCFHLSVTGPTRD
jgi:hypothetical protein